MTTASQALTHVEMLPDTHSRFCSPNADLTLRSRDGVLFRVSSAQMCRASAWFQTMFTLPQSPNADRSTEVIPMGETGDILADLLTIIDGSDLPALDKADRLETLLAVADKYEMPMVKSVVRMAFSSPLLDASPIRVYGIACRMSWKQEAMAASSRTLGIDLSDPALHSEMAAWEPRHRSMLLDLHRRRKKEFLASLDDPLMFSANIVGARCNSTGCTAMLNHTRWWAFKYALATRLIESPVGPGLVDEICCMQEMWDVAEAKCTDCHKELYLMPLTMEHLQSVFRDLPRTVEWDSEDSEEQAT